MSDPNFANRTVWTGDNLDILRGLNSETVDLIYLDPPFNSNQDYAAPVGSKAAGAAFKDTWHLSDLDVAVDGGCDSLKWERQANWCLGRRWKSSAAKEQAIPCRSASRARVTARWPVKRR